MASEITLAPDETVAGRPFADPAHTRREEEALRRLLDYERKRARVWTEDPFKDRKDVLSREIDPEGRRHLLVVPDTRALLEAENPTVVGFFGRPRADADTAVLFELEEELIAGMSAYAPGGLLSYYDVELVKGAYGNLILFAGTEGPVNWRDNALHRKAVDISPWSYHEIRLHLGSLAGRLLDDGTLRLKRTRYLDFNDPEDVWRAVRWLSERD